MLVFYGFIYLFSILSHQLNLVTHFFLCVFCLENAPKDFGNYFPKIVGEYRMLVEWNKIKINMPRN